MVDAAGLLSLLPGKVIVAAIKVAGEKHEFILTKQYIPLQIY